MSTKSNFEISVSRYRNSNNNPLYLFGYILYRPNGEADGKNPQGRVNSYCNNPGTVAFPFDLRQPGNYRIEYFIRERDKNYWEEASWVSIGSIYDSYDIRLRFFLRSRNLARDR